MDALAELEKLRRQALQPAPGSGSRGGEDNGHKEIRRELQFDLAKTDLQRACRFSLTLQLEDQDQQVVDEVREVHVDIDNASSMEQLLLRLKIALHGKEQ